MGIRSAYGTLPYTDREEGGRRLADLLAAQHLTVPVVLALPRGGVAVARPIAVRYHVPLDVLVVRKIGYPLQPELGVGAIAEGGQPVFDREMLDQVGLTERELAAVVENERKELARRVAVYRGDRAPPQVAGLDVIVVDDGIATGVTARAALRALRSQGAGFVVMAAPVGSSVAVAELAAEADAVVVGAQPREFRAVGQWYRHFGQLTDDDVIALIAQTEPKSP